MDHHDLIPHLFRTEHSKITAVLCKKFGLTHIETAEDIVSETFAVALESWPYKGIPDNPVAWLHTVAQNKTKNALSRQHVFDSKVRPALSVDQLVEIDLSEENILDSQVRMLFVVCHPAIPAEAQIGLALRTLCGFGIEEIATAFLANKETIAKRLMRAREVMRQSDMSMELPTGKELQERLDPVLRTIYLLFSEGYYSESNDFVMREDFCLEAMRLAHLLTKLDTIAQPKVFALLALMCFHASRFAARRSGEKDVILYDEQDESLWDQSLISQGVFFLHASAKGNELSKYHLEANVAYWHTVKSDSKEKWERILWFYNLLLQLEYSPVAALNRTYAVSRVHGKPEAIRQALKLGLEQNHFYHTLLGELYHDTDPTKSLKHLQEAHCLARSEHDRKLIQRKLNLVREKQ